MTPGTPTTNEHHYPIPGIDKALRFKLPFRPYVSEHDDQLGDTPSSSENRLSLRVTGRQSKLPILIEVFAKRAVEESLVIVGVCIAQVGKRSVPTASQLHVLLGHRLLRQASRFQGLGTS